MKLQTLAQTLLAALGLGIVATAADADSIAIEPDNPVGLIGDVTPGATPHHGIHDAIARGLLLDSPRPTVDRLRHEPD
jgi:hypothetical protein